MPTNLQKSNITLVVTGKGDRFAWADSVVTWADSAIHWAVDGRIPTNLSKNTITKSMTAKST